MRLVLDPKVYPDIDEIMGYYERVATPGLAEEFYTELRYFMTKAAYKPESFSIRERDIRRANLRRFPYHFLFRVVGHEVRILVRPPSPSTSIFWIEASIGVWPSWKSVAWSGLGFQSGHQVVGVEILSLSKRFGKMSKRWLCLADELTTACKSD
jgi:hypothetical protein